MDLALNNLKTYAIKPNKPNKTKPNQSNFGFKFLMYNS